MLPACAVCRPVCIRPLCTSESTRLSRTASGHRLDVVQVARPLLIGDTIGIAVVTPLLLRFRVREPLETRRLLSLVPESAVYLCLIGVALWLIGGSEEAYGFRLFYLLFVPVVIAAVRHGVDGACLSLAVTLFNLIGLLHFSKYDAGELLTEFQILLLVLTVTGLIVGVVGSERKKSDRIALDAQARLAERQAEVAQVARVNLVSGMTSALAHEINQPMTAARALGRSAQHLLRPLWLMTRKAISYDYLVEFFVPAGTEIYTLFNVARSSGRSQTTLIRIG